KFGRIFSAVGNLRPGGDTSQQYQTFFAQDSWTLTERLTVSAGLRYEWQRLSGSVVKNWTLKDNWAPRAGMTYIVGDDINVMVFANYGRYFARVPNDVAVRSLSADTVVIADYLDANLTRQIPNGTAAGPFGGVHFATAGTGPEQIDPRAKLPYAEEIAGGFAL